MSVADSAPSRGRARPWIWIVGGAVLLLIGVTAVSAWLTRQLGPALTREQVESRLTSALGRTVTVERVVMRPWLGRLAVEGVSVAQSGDAAADASGDPMLRLERAEAIVGVSSLWRRQLVLSRIVLDGFELRYALDDAGERVALPEQIPDRLRVGPLTVLLGGLDLRHGRVHVTDAAGRRVDVEGLRATLRPEDGGLDASASAEAVSVATPELREAIEDVRLDAKLRRFAVSLSRLEARWNGERLRLSGAVTDLDTVPKLALTGGGRLPLDAVAARLGTGVRAAGILTIDGEVTGATASPALSIRVSGSDLKAGALQTGALAGRVRWSDGRLAITDVIAAALGGELRGAMTLAPGRPEDARIDLQFARLSLSALEALSGSSYGIGGQVTGIAELRGHPAKLAEARGNVRIDSAEIILPGELAKLGKADVTADARVASGVVEVVRASVRWPTARVESVTGSLTSEGARDVRVLAVIDLGQLGRLWDEPRVSGEARIAARLNGSWRSPAVRGRVRSPSLTIAQARLVSVELPFRYSGTAVTLDDAQATIGQSRIEASGTVSAVAVENLAALRDPVVLRRALRFDVEVRAPSARIEDLRAWIPAGVSASGRLAVTGRFTGTPSTWRGEGRIDATAAELAGRSIERLGTRFVIDQAGPHVRATPEGGAGERTSGRVE